MLAVCLQVAIVSQEPILFAESILYNIAFAMPKGTASVTMAEVSVSHGLLV